MEEDIRTKFSAPDFLPFLTKKSGHLAFFKLCVDFKGNSRTF